ncbi:secretoglobin, family 2B, member 19 precursor [Mus musculus]|uniref:ABPBG19 n=1 Tax=Mus musculus TaxID=10090 RepID=J3QM75_MOUSE|nr:secretoglobin, family 2B, member 19 precursor [Mus musculus]AIQ80440.1 ABPBG19 [Mus musculus]EDL01251.1 mCG1039283 [Mus musculus]|eukprot:NP_001186265.1 secretoglobin, family 2B, member 19 precursor [Mus musculus]
MKGTLLLLGLLITGELSFQTTEACVPFFEGYASVVSGSRVWLYHELQSFDATAEEKVALEKIQGCYREERLRNILLEPKIMEAMVASPECRSYYSLNNFRSILDFISNLLGE